MPVNKYLNSDELCYEDQQIINDLVIEAIQAAGIDVYYIRRADVNLDDVYLEDSSQKYTNAYLIEMYLQDFQGYEGQGEMYTKFGIQIRDQVSLIVSKSRFEEDICTAEEIGRPLEGDLIFLPIYNDIFEIKYVKYRDVFYQAGDLYRYLLKCNKFEFSSEPFNTGIPEVDILNNRSQSVSVTTPPTLISNDPVAENIAFETLNQQLNLLDESEINLFAELQ